MRTKYNVASELDPHGENFTRKQDALRVCNRNNRELLDHDGNTLPKTWLWSEDQVRDYEHLIYEVTATRDSHDGGLQYGTVEPNGYINWS